MVKKSFTKKPFRVKVKCEKDLTYEETLGAVIWLYNRDTDTFRKIVQALESQGGEIDCKFTNLCKKFPCENLVCEADALDGRGYPVSL